MDFGHNEKLEMTHNRAGNISSWFRIQEQEGAREPEDSGKAVVGKLGYEEYYNDVRMKYLMGLQWMMELQCEAFVPEFQVSPLICGVASTVWLRFLAGTGVFNEAWANRVILESELERQLPDGPQECKLVPVCNDESQEPGYEDLLKDSRIRYPNEPYNSRGQRAVMIWLRWLKKEIPLSTSLAVVFLACHVAREAVLPTDLIKWSMEGKLPYFAAHVEIEKRFERPSAACPISTIQMFRPDQSVPLQKLESKAAAISESIGLHFPPVNFYEIASCYLKQLSLPVQKILPHACLIYEWSMPPDLWLSTNETKLPTRVYLLSMLIVSIRIQYDINGFGVWERSLSTPIGNASNIQKFGLDVEELLVNLENKYHELNDPYDFAKDLPSYLKHCKDTIFAESRSSSLLDPVEEDLIEKLMDFYQNEKYSEAGEDDVFSEIPAPDTSTNNVDFGSQHDLNGDRDSNTPPSERNSERRKEVPSVSSKDDSALRRLKLNMEENRFTYIPPRVNIKRRDYLCYARKKDAGAAALAYATHADYYILLRACARVAQVDVRIMHTAVLSFERRLAWLEERIYHCLQSTPSNITYESCSSAPDS